MSLTAPVYFHRGHPSAEDDSVAAQLMRVKDDKGNFLPHARQWSELSIFFYAGVSHPVGSCAAVFP
jgi:hypothetical protein